MQVRRALFATAALAAVATATPVFAADFYWTGAVSSDWNDAGNWVDGGGAAVLAAPGGTDTAIFDARPTANDPAVDASAEILDVIFNVDGAVDTSDVPDGVADPDVVTIDGAGVLTVNRNIINNAPNDDRTIDVRVSGSSTGNGTGRLLLNADGGDINLGQGLTGDMDVVKDGSKQLDFKLDNTSPVASDYTGTFFLKSGFVNNSASNIDGVVVISGDLVVNGGQYKGNDGGETIADSATATTNTARGFRDWDDGETVATVYMNAGSSNQFSAQNAAVFIGVRDDSLLPDPLDVTSSTLEYVTAGGLYAGTGDAEDTVLVGGTISPGDPRPLTVDVGIGADALTLELGHEQPISDFGMGDLDLRNGTIVFEFKDASETAGVGWDVLSPGAITGNGGNDTVIQVLQLAGADFASTFDNTMEQEFVLIDGVFTDLPNVPMLDLSEFVLDLEPTLAALAAPGFSFELDYRATAIDTVSGTPGNFDGTQQLILAYVPEPASLALLGLGSLAVLGRRRNA